MHIAVNTRLLVDNRLDGIGIFARETLSRIVRAHPEHDFTFIFTHPWIDDFIFADNVTPVLMGPPLREPLSQVVWQEIRLPRLLRRIGAEVYVSPEPTHSLRSDHLPRLEVLHDLNFEHHPEVLPFYWRYYYRLMARRHARAADRIATVSRYSKEDIVRTYGIAPERIDIVYNGAPEGRRGASEEERTRLRQTWGKGNDYFYFVGTIQERKNIAGMLRAFEIFREKGASEGTTTRLLIAGRKKWWTDEMEEVYRSMTYREEVDFVGRLDDDQLHEMASGSIGLLFVPFFEGFGIPILEAYGAGVPVITSDATSMPEVAGNAALLVDPNDPTAIASAMQRLQSDPDLRRELVERGRLRTDLFTWEKTAASLWHSIEQILPTSSP